MKKRVTSLLLVFAMLLSMLPAMAFAADEATVEHAITVSGKTEHTTTQGALLEVKMSELFQDSEGHTMTYTLSEGDYGTQTGIKQDKEGAWELSFTNPNTGTYTPTITATCADDSSVTAAATLTIIVEAGEKGDERQYGYDETDQGSVKVYVTISSDGVPIIGYDGTVLSHLEVNVPYFDLGNQGLSDFYRYGTKNGSGSYVNDTIIKRPTALHLYLYMIGVYYLGLEPEQVTTGEVKIFGHDGVGDGVENMLGKTAYEDTSLALNITGSATSLYMQQFWGHDENLMYYRNHVYPLMGPGWGSTADYILLSDNDTIDVAMFANWSFWTYGAFACFDLDEYSVQPGKSISFSTLKYDTKSVADGGTEQTDPITGLTVAVYDENWKWVADVAPIEDGGSDYTYTFATAGTYYLLAMDPNAGDNSSTGDACYAPATAKVTVGGGEKPFDPAEYYKDFDFASITLDPAGTDYIYNIAESQMYVAHFSAPGDKKVYTVTVPTGTDMVYVTYPADFDKTILDYTVTFNESGSVVGYSVDGYAVTQNDDGSTTIAVPTQYALEEQLYIAAECSDGYDYFNCFYFVTGDNTKPGGDGKVAVTGVTLDQDALTVNRGETAELTATVLPVDAANKKVSWQTGDRSIATVNKGVVTGVSEGETTITVTTADGGYTAQCTVAVTDVNKPTVAEDGYYEIATAAQVVRGRGQWRQQCAERPPDERHRPQRRLQHEQPLDAHRRQCQQ